MSLERGENAFMGLLLGGGTNPGLAIGTSTNSLLSSSIGVSRLNIGCPFVSLSGIELLVAPITPAARWDNPEKHWLVGLHQGITEPAALRHLLHAANSSAKIFTRGRKLDSRALAGTPIFHAKIIALEVGAGQSKRLNSVLISSANVTRAALGPDPYGTNFEAGSVLKVVSASENIAWRSWWQTAWDQGIALTDPLIVRYEQLRDEFLRKNPATQELLDPPSSGLLASASTMWIEAGAMSGGSRNQVEFSRDLAAFFGTPVLSSRPLVILFGKRSWTDRPLSPKVTTFNVPIWRLSLPTTTQGGPPYPGQVICFERESASGGYRITVAQPSSAVARQWRKEAGQTGYLGRTSGDRAFGLF